MAVSGKAEAIPTSRLAGLSTRILENVNSVYFGGSFKFPRIRR